MESTSKPATPLVHLCTEPYSCALSPLLFLSPYLIKFSLSPRSFLLAYKDAMCCAKLLQSCPTLRNPMDHSPPGFSVHGILQAKMLEWVAMPSSRGSSNPGIEPTSPLSLTLQVNSLPTEPPRKPCRYSMLLLLLSHFSRVRLCATPETAAHQAPPSLGFSRQEHWSGLPFPSPMHESEK